MATPSSFTQAEIIKARDILRAHVKKHGRVINGKPRGNFYMTYGELARAMGWELEDEWEGDAIGRLVGGVSTMEHDCGNPLLSCIVVRADTRYPGSGFFSLGRDLEFISTPSSKKEEMDLLNVQLLKTVEKWGRIPSSK